MVGMAEAAKEKALELVPYLTALQLVDVCGNYNLQLKSDLKVGRKQALKNVLRRYIHAEEHDESDDKGMAFFTKLIGEMEEMVAENTEDEDSNSNVSKKTMKVEETSSLGESGSAEGEALRRLLAQLGLSDSSKSGAAEAFSSFLKVASGGGKLDESALMQLGQDVGSLSKESAQASTSNSKATSKSDAQDGTRSRVVHRLKEFKIDGKIGHGENPLSFHNIQYQISDAEDLEYKWKEISSAILKAMKGGSSIRNYFERNPDLDKDEFMEMLESLLDEEKESSDLVLEMKAKVQGKDEKVLNYVLDMVSLKKQIVKESAEEGNPIGDDLVWKWCTRAILEGLRYDPIRQEMRTILSNPQTNEPELMKKVKQLVKVEQEHLRKTGEDDGGTNSNQKQRSNTKRNADVNQLSVSNGLGTQKTDEKNRSTGKNADVCKEDDGFSKLDAKLDLIVQQMGECVEVIPVVRGLEQDVKSLKKEMKELKENPAVGQPFRRPILKCEECKKTNAFCRHCAKCGEEGHKLSKCPKN